MKNLLFPEELNPRKKQTFSHAGELGTIDGTLFGSLLKFSARE